MANILLVEPGYKNKYPPLGLMKISTFHKNRGDTLLFVKGLSNEAVLKIWDRVYITTLFTFHFDITVSTIRFYKKCVSHVDNIYVGGILATLMEKQLRIATGVNNIIPGQLDDEIKIGFLNHSNIDILPPDYDILDDIKYIYPAGDNYFAYTTRGCPNHCPFCAVPVLEPEFKTTNSIFQQISTINDRYGAKRNLLLLDNNILFSPELPKIVKDIKVAGFEKLPNFIEPSPILTFCRRIKAKINEENNLSRALEFLKNFTCRIKAPDKLELFNKTLMEINDSSDQKKALLDKIEFLLPVIEKYRNRVPKQRYVDFNQGIDARLFTEDRIKILCELPINPLRIAFDSISQAKIYIKAVKLANIYGFRDISNYMLYNHNDKPEHLWERLYINANLRKELGINIFSFPMKYIPISRTDRGHLGKYWNKKYIRAIQSILLVTKGIASTTRGFFEKAFGNTIEEYFEILMMPEDFIIYRKHFEKKLGLTEEWSSLYRSINELERLLLLESIKNNKPEYLKDQYYPENLKKLLSFYEIQYINSK